MGIRHERYGSQPAFGHQYERVRQFLLAVNRPHIINSNFLWARWEWAMSLITAYGGSLEHNGLWYDDDTLVALVTNEVSLGQAFFITLPGYEFLKADMLDYAIQTLGENGPPALLIPDSDRVLQLQAANRGYLACQDTEVTSGIDLSRSLSAPVPEGFSLARLSQGYDLKKLQRCTYRGFGNGLEVPDTQPSPTEVYQGPWFDKGLHTVVIAPNGDYASYCGAWYDPSTDYAYLEPVCTDPDYRLMGLGKAAVYASLRACARRGAKTAFVISRQQFYYNIGFYPAATGTWWRQEGAHK